MVGRLPTMTGSRRRQRRSRPPAGKDPASKCKTIAIWRPCLHTEPPILKPRAPDPVTLSVPALSALALSALALSALALSVLALSVGHSANDKRNRAMARTRPPR
jgi:hypothetical protein